MQPMYCMFEGAQKILRDTGVLTTAPACAYCSKLRRRRAKRLPLTAAASMKRPSSQLCAPRAVASWCSVQDAVVGEKSQYRHMLLRMYCMTLHGQLWCDTPASRTSGGFQVHAALLLHKPSTPARMCQYDLQVFNSSIITHQRPTLEHRQLHLAHGVRRQDFSQPRQHRQERRKAAFEGDFAVHPLQPRVRRRLRQQ